MTYKSTVILYKIQRACFMNAVWWAERGYYGNADGQQTNCSQGKEAKDPSAFPVTEKNSHFKAINFGKDQ